MLFQIAQRRRWFFTLSSVVILAGLIAMAYSTVTTGLPVKLSIDFLGGSIFELAFQGSAIEPQIRQVFAEFDLTEIVVQRLGGQDENRWQVRTPFVSPAVTNDIKRALSEQVAPLDEGKLRIDQVTPTIGAEVTQAAILATLVAAVVILGFIVFAFRQVPNAIRYGACAIIAMIHDILVTLGVMSMLGLLLGWEVDALFLTAMLTVVGFSVQDTIVVFDRIRENIPKRRGEPFETIINRSLLETIHRSLATQLNAVFVMIAILLFGGETIRQFIGILLIGLISGTYSSIFTAVPLLVAWEQGELPFVNRAARAAKVDTALVR